MVTQARKLPALTKLTRFLYCGTSKPFLGSYALGVSQSAYRGSSLQMRLHTEPSWYLPEACFITSSVEKTRYPGAPYRWSGESVLGPAFRIGHCTKTPAKRVCITQDFLFWMCVSHLQGTKGGGGSGTGAFCPHFLHTCLCSLRSPESGSWGSLLTLCWEV